MKQRGYLIISGELAHSFAATCSLPKLETGAEAAEHCVCASCTHMQRVIEVRVIKEKEGDLLWVLVLDSACVTCHITDRSIDGSMDRWKGAEGKAGRRSLGDLSRCGVTFCVECVYCDM